MKKKTKQTPPHRLFIRVRDKKQDIIIENGKRIIPVKWVEVIDVDLGSIKDPNKEIYGTKFEPVILERKENVL